VTTETDGGASCALDDEASADIAQNDGRYTARYEGTARPARYQGAAGARIRPDHSYLRSSRRLAMKPIRHLDASIRWH
jgi:hypothetical protein